MEESFSLKDVALHLQNCIVKLDKGFLQQLLIQASNSEKPYKNFEFSKEIKAKWNKKYGSITIRNWFNGQRNIKIKYLKRLLELSKYCWKDIEENLIFIKAGLNHGECCPQFPIKIDKTLGAVVGHILGDGSIDKRYAQIFFSNCNVDLLHEFEESMYKIFHIKPRIWVQKIRKFEEKSYWIKRVSSLDDIPKFHPVGLFYPKICASILYSVLGKFACGYHKELTLQIFNSPHEFKKALIRAFFDDEGSITPESYTIRVFQDKKEILDGISKMLTSFGIEPNCIRYYIKRDKKRFYFDITGYANFIKFRENIGFSSPAKHKKLILLINQVGKSVSFRLRNNKSKKEILEILRNNHMLTVNGIAKELRQKYKNMKWVNTSVNMCLSKLKAENLVTSKHINNVHFWFLT